MNSKIKSASTEHRWWWNGINPELERNCVGVYVHACMSKVALEAEMNIDPNYVYWMYLSLQCMAHPPQKCIKNQYPVQPAGRNADLFAQPAYRIAHQKHLNVCHGSSQTPTL